MCVYGMYVCYMCMYVGGRDKRKERRERRREKTRARKRNGGKIMDIICFYYLRIMVIKRKMAIFRLYLLNGLLIIKRIM